MESQLLSRPEALPGHHSSTRAGVFDSVEAVLHLDRATIVLTEESNLYELGLDSIIVVELLTDLEDRFSIRLEIEDLSEELFAKLGHLVALVESKREA